MISPLQRCPRNESALIFPINKTKKLVWTSSYKDQLAKWVKNAPLNKRNGYQAVADAILRSELVAEKPVSIKIDCHGLDTLPPLPAQWPEGILLVLKGQPDVTLDVFLTHLTDNVVSLTFCDNPAIQTFSSEMIPAFIPTLHIENCPNFSHFVGEFTIKKLKLSNLFGQSLFLLKDNFPKLCYLRLKNNTNLESIEVSKPFKLNRLDIYGDHNRLKAVPSFSELKIIDIDPCGLASISDYSWFHHVNWFKWLWPVELAENHHQLGKPAATLKLIEMADYILSRTYVDKTLAKKCLEALVGKSAACAPSEIVLGKLFLDGKLIDSNYQQARKFFPVGA